MRIRTKTWRTSSIFFEQTAYSEEASEKEEEVQGEERGGG